MPSVRHGKRLYKQMSLEVATRNPERFEGILRVFSKYDGTILNDQCILEIYSDLFLYRVIDSNKLSEEDLNKDFLKKYIVDNITHNNEWGFPTGYQAAFCRYLKTLSEFGFIYSQYNQELKLSSLAKALVAGKITSAEAFSLQCIRFWRKSPFRRVLNDFNYFKFIVDVIIKLNLNGCSLSLPQFMVSLFSTDGDVDNFIKLIDEKKIGNDLDKAYDLVYSLYHLITPEYGKVNNQETSFRDYGNTVFRMLQLTGFVSVNSSGIITLSINKNRLPYYEKLCTFDFSLTEEEKESEILYFEKLGYFSQELYDVILEFREKEDLSTRDYNVKVKNIVEQYSLTTDIIGKYLKDLSEGKKDSKCFWYLQAPLKLEFLLTIYTYLCYGDQFEYKPNFKCDDNGIPYSHAPGNVGDIEVFNRDNYWLIEATLIRNKTQQINSETINLFRHITELSYDKKYMMLVAPYIHDDTELMINVATLIVSIEKGKTVYATTNTINDFIETTVNNNNLSLMEEKNVSFINSIKEYCERI